jgi:hypothetical protein
MRIRWAIDDNGNRISITATTDREKYYLPILPDVIYDGKAPLPVKPDTKTLPWPSRKLDPETLRPAVRARVDAVLTKPREQELPGFGGWALEKLVEPGLASAVTDQIVNLARDGLVNQDLLPKQN